MNTFIIWEIHWKRQNNRLTCLICRRWYTLDDILNWFVRVSLFFLLHPLPLITARNYLSSFFFLHICTFIMQTISIIQMNCNQTTATTTLAFTADDLCSIVSSAAQRNEIYIFIFTKQKRNWNGLCLIQWFINFLHIDSIHRIFIQMIICISKSILKWFCNWEIVECWSICCMHIL